MINGLKEQQADEERDRSIPDCSDECRELIERHRMHIRRELEEKALMVKRPLQYLLHSNRAFHHLMRQSDIEDDLIVLAEKGDTVAGGYILSYYDKKVEEG